jgi:hypothetical protein
MDIGYFPPRIEPNWVNNSRAWRQFLPACGKVISAAGKVIGCIISALIMLEAVHVRKTQAF